MGERPAHFPRTQAKLAYDARCLYVVFRVEDNFVRAVASKHQDPVYKDSCVEFFFTPGLNTADGYFNLEMNCGGTMLFHFQKVPRQNSLTIPASELDRIEVAHSLPQRIDPEIRDSTTWVVEYRMPFDLLLAYFPDTQPPKSGSRWRANFYKCADETSQPHWLTWALIDHPVPDFHRPESFGILEFD